MAPQNSVSTFVSRACWLPCVAGLFLNACGTDPAESTGPSGGTNAGTSTTGGTASGSVSMGAGPTSNGSSMGPGTAMGSSSTGAATTGVGPTTTSTGGASSSNGSGTGGVGGGSSTGGTDGQTSGGATNTGAGGTGGGSVECSRELLTKSLDDYLAALTAGDPSTLPLAADLKFTENAEQSEIGTTEFWMNAGEVKHSQSALDVEACTVAAHSVIPEGATDLPVAIRIKLEAGEMIEIETLVVRPGDYTADFAVPSNPDAIIDIADEVGWHDVVPEGAERASREVLIAWMDKYFRFFTNGVCNVSQDCTRLENGGGSFSCGAGAMCTPGDPGPNDANLNPRLILADVERGIVVGFTILSGQTDMHMAKMSGGEVHAVQAILGDYGGQSGWE